VQVILASDLDGKLAKAHSAQSLDFYFIAAAVLESKAALGLDILENHMAEHATIY